MALNTTTASSAINIGDRTITVASATGAAAGTFVKVDDEVMLITKAYSSGTTIPVLRGQDGTLAAAHPATSNVQFFLGSDETAQGPQSAPQWPIAGKPRVIQSYSSSGAIALPAAGTDTMVILNGTSTLTMTLASPTKDLDGCLMYIFANGKAAHTVTVNTGTAGIGNGGSTMDVGTFATTEATGCALVALNGFWVLWANGIASSGTQLAGVVFA